MIARILRGPVLNPSDTPDRVDYWPDGAIAVDERNLVVDAGPWAAIRTDARVERTPHIICPPFLDAHIHIPQHPIRGHFTDGVDDADPNGRLMAGLNRNVFPAEGKFSNRAYAQQVIRHFAEDTLAHGVVGGAAYSTVHADAAENALDMLGEFWSVGLVLMNQNCPDYLRTSEHVLAQIAHLSVRFGNRHIITDRFAVACDSTLRRFAVAEAERFGLRTQTHLDEQRSEKRLVEQKLYPDAGSYTNVYLHDGLLDREAILAHCVHMTDAELCTLAEKRSSIAHCPTSNTLLGSGVMPLDRVLAHGIPFALCTDVGASPTTSMLVEMAQFLKVHAGRSSRATPSAALWRSTLAPARVLHLDLQLGRFAPGMPLSYVEIDPGHADLSGDADAVIAAALLGGRITPPEPAAVDRLEREGLGTGLELSLLTEDVTQTAAALDTKVMSVTLAGQTAWRR
jgi:guanine deaminase